MCCTWASPFWWLNTQMLANWFMKPFGRIQKPLHLETGQNKDKKTLTFWCVSPQAGMVISSTKTDRHVTLCTQGSGSSYLLLWCDECTCLIIHKAQNDQRTSLLTTSTLTHSLCICWKTILSWGGSFYLLIYKNTCCCTFSNMLR